MSNIDNKKTPMREQNPDLRNKNFSEVALGYTEKEALDEASRCLSCKNHPCVSGCPVNVMIDEFIALIKRGEFENAYQKISETNSLPAVCGRVCPQEKQCESKCVRGIKGEPVAIGRLERFAADYHMQNAKVTLKENKKKNGKQVAVIGAGPAGLTCAGDLNKAGFDVTVFEALHTPGGVLMYGIPEFRLPKKIVNTEIEALKNAGVKIEVNSVVGRAFSIDELFYDMGFNAVFVGSGAGLPTFMGLPGENLNGVYSANEFLTRVNLMKAYDFPNTDTPIRVGSNVVVVGGGNVAMDAARCAKRLGADVKIVYRRSLEEMPARIEEIHHAKEEGIEFLLLKNPVEILGNESGFVKEIKCISMELGDVDASGRRRPKPIANSEFILQASTVIIAIGNSPNPLIIQTTKGLETEKWGGIKADEYGKTSRDLVYAGGDAVTGAATVILAMGAGKLAAKSIIDALL
ncbi:MAG: NADPH-dependent glutamate synthase [Clostridia bacterium]